MYAGSKGLKMNLARGAFHSFGKVSRLEHGDFLQNERISGIFTDFDFKLLLGKTALSFSSIFSLLLWQL